MLKMKETIIQNWQIVFLMVSGFGSLYAAKYSQSSHLSIHFKFLMIDFADEKSIIGKV